MFALDGLEIKRHEAPLHPDNVRQIDAFLLKIFEYGDYSFHRALSGGYGPDLRYIFCTGERKGSLICAAGCLMGRENPCVAIIGPIGVASEWRGRGIGSNLLARILNYLKSQGCVVAYLGVRQENRAVNLYARMGFEKHAGIVMRKFLGDEKQLSKCYRACGNVRIRKMCWGDYPAVMALATLPADMYTFDLQEGLFSSRYVEPSRFLSVFPKIMNEFEEHGGFGNVLLSEDSGAVVGIAQIRKIGDLGGYGAELEFFAHDNFLEHAGELLMRTLEESKYREAGRIACQCLACDGSKRGIIESVGGRVARVLPESVRVGNSLVGVVLYVLDA